MIEIEISMVVSVSEKITQEEFENKFIEWVEQNGWTCGGSIGPVKED
jgi:hypothetical protein